MPSPRKDDAETQARKGSAMADPVIHFEIIGTNPEQLRSYYGDMFGWEFDTSSQVSDAVSEPDNYGFVGQSSTSGGVGIPGGVGGGPGYGSRAMFYVNVADVETALQDAERLGGTRVMGPEQAPTGLVVGHFTDPEGNLIGVAGTK
jgi:predicted enzyme related to lactoylglutathione lyase